MELTNDTTPKQGNQRPAEKSASRRSSSRRRRPGNRPAPSPPAPAGEAKLDKMMLINYVRGEECRIAVTTNGKLEELLSERASAESHVGNIYKGRITNVEPSIQAAFIDFGFEKNGFLHISDLHPQYFARASQGRHHATDGVKERVGQKTPRRERPPIQQCLRRGQEIVVQMTKEGIGSKGPTLTTYVSIPGRYLVLMPGMSRLGISRKIEDEETRRKLRQVVAELEMPDNIGFIVRTAGIDRSKRELQRDLNYLKRLWKVVQHRINTSRAPAEVYQESDLVTRTIRDIFTPDIEKVIVDDEEIAHKARDFLDIVMPRYAERVEYYDQKIPLFYRYSVEDQIVLINSRRVELPSGGFVIIDQAEALVAIDVNSGKFRQIADAEQTALEINLEATDEIMRQLKLRDLGGVIVIDFIDMRHERNRREVERRVREALRTDRAKTKVLKMSQFGIIELTRQRVRPSRERCLHFDCPHCAGTGQIKTPESVSLDVMRLIQLALYQKNVERLEVSASATVCEYLHNRRKRELTHLEDDTHKKIRLLVGKDLSPEAFQLRCFDARDREIPLDRITCVKTAGDEKTIELHTPHVHPSRDQRRRDQEPARPEPAPPPEPTEIETLVNDSVPLEMEEEKIS